VPGRCVAHKYFISRDLYQIIIIIYKLVAHSVGRAADAERVCVCAQHIVVHTYIFVMDNAGRIARQMQS